jgi:hypothetical protein
VDLARAMTCLAVGRGLVYLVAHTNSLSMLACCGLLDKGDHSQSCGGLIVMTVLCIGAEWPRMSGILSPGFKGR